MRALTGLRFTRAFGAAVLPPLHPAGRSGAARQWHRASRVLKDMNADKMPGWLVVLLSVLAVAVLGPPALVLVLIALGAALAVGVALLKVSLVALAVVAVVMVVRALFGNRRRRGLPVAEQRESIESIASRMEAEERERRADLDRQLAEALQVSR